MSSNENWAYDNEVHVTVVQSLKPHSSASPERRSTDGPSSNRRRSVRSGGSKRRRSNPRRRQSQVRAASMSSSEEDDLPETPSYAVYETKSGRLLAPNRQLIWPEPMPKKDGASVVRRGSVGRSIEKRQPEADEENGTERVNKSQSANFDWNPFEIDADSPTRRRSSTPSSSLSTAFCRTPSIIHSRTDSIALSDIEPRSTTSRTDLTAGPSSDAKCFTAMREMFGDQFMGVSTPGDMGRQRHMQRGEFVIYYARGVVDMGDPIPATTRPCKLDCPLADGNLRLSVCYRTIYGEHRHYPIGRHSDALFDRQSKHRSTRRVEAEEKSRFVVECSAGRPPMFASLRELISYHNKFAHSSPSSMKDAAQSSPSAAIIDGLTTWEPFAWWLDDKCYPKGRYCCTSP